MRTFCLLLALFPATVLGQQDFSKVDVTSTDLGRGVHMLVGAGGNLGVSTGPDGAFLIDDQFAPLTPKIQAAIARFSPQPVRFVVNTHWHGDHSGGNENFGKAGSLIVAHENVRRRMSTEQFMEAMNRRVPASPAGALPVVTFTDTISFYVNGDTLRVFHVRNAHTDGDAIVWFRAANVVHMGDAFVNGTYPFIDVSSDGSLRGIVAAADRVLAAVDDRTKIIPGHGALATRADLQRYRDVLAQIHARLLAEARRGRTVEQVLAAGLTKQWDAAWGAGFMKPDVFTRLAYESVRRELRPAGRRGR
jgi:cyclase